MPSLTLLLFALLLREGSCTFSLFLPSKAAYQEQYLQPADTQPLYSQQYSSQQYLDQPDSQQQYSSQQYLEHPDSQQQYSQQQYPAQQNPRQQVDSFWPDNGQPNEEYQQQDDPSAGYRYQALYQSTYRHHVHGVPAAVYTTSYPNSVYQAPIHQPAIHQPAIHQPSLHQFSLDQPAIQQSAIHQPSTHHHSYHHQEPVTVPGLHHRLASPPTVPVYQLVTVGPELPVLIRLPNQQTAVLPVRTIYSLPGFLERFVQRVQNYYSVYNPLEVLQVPRFNETESETTPETPSNSTSTDAPSDSTSASNSTTAGNSTESGSEPGLRQGDSNAATLKVFEVETTTAVEATSDQTPTTVTESNEVQETTTTA